MSLRRDSTCALSRWERRSVRARTVPSCIAPSKQDRLSCTTSEPGVQSLRVPASRPAFPADCPHPRIVTSGHLPLGRGDRK
jgi:hypothetical protein